MCISLKRQWHLKSTQVMAVEQGPLFKKKNYKMRTEEEELESALVLGGSSLYEFLGSFARRCFGCYGLSSRLDKGALGVHKELKRQRVGRVGHTIWDLWMVSTDVVFKHTTLVPIGKDHLQSLLIIFLHGLFLPAILRMKGGHLIFGRLEL